MISQCTFTPLAEEILEKRIPAECPKEHLLEYLQGLLEKFLHHCLEEFQKFDSVKISRKTPAELLAQFVE